MADELTPEEQEEFEFRARAEHEARAGKAPAPEPAPDVTAGAVEPSMGEKIMGAAQIPFQYAIEHPAALAAGAGVYKAGTMANKYLEGQRKLASEHLFSISRAHRAYCVGIDQPRLREADFAVKLKIFYSEQRPIQSHLREFIFCKDSLVSEIMNSI